MTYLIGTDKILCKVNSPLISGWEECIGIKQLMLSAKKPIGNAVNAGVRWMGTRIPLEQMKKVLGTVHQFPHTECGFILEYRAEDGAWNIELTEQQGQSAFVRWEDTRQHDGFMSMGTIHTHPEMNAFFSGTDHHNDEGQYGVHIVLGLTDGHAVRTACRIYTPTGHYDQNIWDICEKWDESADYEPVQAWVDIVNKGIKEQQHPMRIFDLRLPSLSSEMRSSAQRYDVCGCDKDVHCVIDDANGELEDEEWDCPDYAELEYDDIDVFLLPENDIPCADICHNLVMLRNALNSPPQAKQTNSDVDMLVTMFETSVGLDDMDSRSQHVVKMLEHEVLSKYYASKLGMY